MTRIAFVCTGNTGRSVIAEALARAMITAHGLKFDVLSRGTHLDPAHDPVEAHAASLLHARGLSVDAHRPASLTAADIAGCDLVLTMTEAHRDTVLARFPGASERVFTLAQRATGASADVADAFGQPIEAYQSAFAQIEALVTALIEGALPQRAPATDSTALA